MDLFPTGPGALFKSHRNPAAFATYLSNKNPTESESASLGLITRAAGRLVLESAREGVGPVPVRLVTRAYDREHRHPTRVQFTSALIAAGPGVEVVEMDNGRPTFSSDNGAYTFAIKARGVALFREEPNRLVQDVLWIVPLGLAGFAPLRAAADFTFTL